MNSKCGSKAKEGAKAMSLAKAMSHFCVDRESFVCVCVSLWGWLGIRDEG